MKNNWQIKKLGEVCDFQNGFAFKSKLFKETGLPILRISNIQNEGISYNRLIFFDKKNYKEDFDKYRVVKGDLVIAMSGATTGKLAICDADEIFYLNQRVGKFKPKKDLSNDYLYYFLTTRIEENLKISAGSAQPNLSTEQIKSFKIPLPPISEQHRIVKILNEVFADVAKAKENAEKNLQNAKELFESYLQSVFVNMGKNWEEKELGDVGKISMCKRVFKYQTTKIGDIPFYKIGTFGKKPNAFISNEIYDEFRKKFSFPKKGDILISASGTIGRRVKYDGKSAYFQDSNIVWIDNDEKQVFNDYLYHFYGSCDWNSTKGATISRLYNDNLKQIRIQFPKSHAEQKSIVSKLDALSAETKKLEAIYKQKLKNLEELKKSVLKSAFAGKY